MSEETKPTSAEAGSVATVPAESGKAGETEKTTTSNSQNYEELEKKLGKQGEELGEYRKFIDNVTPLLQRLDANPDLIKAIMDGKMDQKFVSALLEGKVKIEEAQQVVEAHEQVKQEMGDKAFKNADPAEIERKILEKASEMVTGAIEQKFKTIEEQRNFEDKVDDFIADTTDFAEYADKISTWLSEHPEQDDIEVAYHAVKGLVLSEKLGKEADKNNGEAAKTAAANAGGGNAPSSGKVNSSDDIWDKLVASKGNPNIL